MRVVILQIFLSTASQLLELRLCLNIQNHLLLLSKRSSGNPGKICLYNVQGSVSIDACVMETDYKYTF